MFASLEVKKIEESRIEGIDNGEVNCHFSPTNDIFITCFGPERKLAVVYGGEIFTLSQ